MQEAKVPFFTTRFRWNIPKTGNNGKPTMYQVLISVFGETLFLGIPVMTEEGARASGK